MLRNLLQGCLVAGALAATATACSGVTGTETGARGDEPQSFASEAQELKWIDEALHKDPKDPLANKRADDFNARSDKKLGLVHTVDMKDGRVMKFYQDATGQNSIGTTMPIGAPKFNVRLAGRIFAEIFHDLKPSEAIPETITEADSRAQERMLRQTPEEPHIPAPAEDRAHSSLSTNDSLSEAPGQELVEKSYGCSFFKNNDCTYGGDWDVCNCNVHEDASLSFARVTYAYHAVAVAAGALTLDVVHNGYTAAHRVIRDGEVQGFFMASDGSNCGPSCGTWQACGVQPCTAVHGQDIYNVSADETYHRNMCIERLGSPYCT